MHFVDAAQDRWQALGSDGSAAAAAQAHSMLTVEQWRQLRDAWPAHRPLGLELPNTLDIATIGDELHAHAAATPALIVLQFPKWTDGRAYSQARLLRVRHRFVGQIRASGDVVVDMLPLLQRTGFDAVRLRDGQDVAAARRALGFFAGHYQGDVLQPQPWFARQAA
jgi:uncharacterized protein (DUF934 family)